MPVAKMYKACALIHNAQTCLYRNNTSDDFNSELPCNDFNCQPPSLENYFVNKNNMLLQTFTCYDYKQ